MGMGWVWDAFHLRKEKLDGVPDPWLWDELFHGVYRVQGKSRDEHPQESRLRLSLHPPGGTLRLCYIPPARASPDNATTLPSDIGRRWSYQPD